MPEIQSTTPKLTLNWFFWEPEADAVEAGPQADGRGRALDAMKGSLGAVPGVEWKVLSGELLSQLEALLDIDLGELVFSAWERYRMLQKYADREAYPPEETFMVPLAKHKIQSSHRPYVEIMVDDRPLGRLDFDIRLTLELEGLLLKVRDGRVREISAGTCRGVGTLKCGQVLIKEEKSRRFALPGRIDLGEGVAIPAA